MQKTESIMELLSGYEAYSNVEEINMSAATDAPATSTPCAASFGMSWTASLAISKTYDQSC